MIIAFTGHRTDKIGGYELNGLPKVESPIYKYIYNKTEQLLLELKHEKCISGMALGFDQIGAELCIKHKIPFIAAVPFKGQESRWSKICQMHYQQLLRNAIEIKIVSEGMYHASKMEKRNRWIIQNSNDLIACFNGLSGGTYNCIDYFIRYKTDNEFNIMKFNDMKMFVNCSKLTVRDSYCYLINPNNYNK